MRTNSQIRVKSCLAAHSMHMHFRLVWTGRKIAFRIYIFYKLTFELGNDASSRRTKNVVMTFGAP